MNSEEIYKLQTLKVLSGFQMLEFSLKVYVATAYNLTRHKLQGAIPFKYTYKDIKNHPLERLLNTFQKLNDNVQLQGRLNKLREGRNYIAHQALLVSHVEFRDILDGDLDESLDKVASLEQELDNCLELMAQELQKIFSINSEHEA